MRRRDHDAGRHDTAIDVAMADGVAASVDAAAAVNAAAATSAVRNI